MSVDGLFGSILAASIWGSVLTALFMLFNKTLRNKLPANWHYYIWVIVLVRLLVPAFITIGGGTDNQAYFVPAVVNRQIIETTSANELPSHEMKPQNVLPGSVTSEGMTLPDQKSYTTLTEPVQESNISINDIFTYNNAFILWLIVTALIFLWKSASYIIFMKRLRANNKALTGRYQELFLEQLSESVIKSNVKVFQNINVSTPFVAGIFNPVIILPVRDYSEMQLTLIIKHELTHIQRRDIALKWLFEAAKIVHWFNPSVYLAARSAYFYCEASCDEAMMKNSGLDRRKEYSMTLVDIVGQGVSQNPLSVAMCSGKSDLKRRISLVLDHGRMKTSIPLLLTITILSILFSACSGFKLKEEKKPANAASIVESVQKTDIADTAGMSGITNPETGDTLSLTESQQESDAGRINVLIAGVRDNTSDFFEAADVIMLASFNPENSKIDLISIPRDTYLSLSNETISKLSEKILNVSNDMKVGELVAYAEKEDKMPLLKNEIGNLLNMQIDRYVKIDMPAFVQIINIFGGVTITVPEGGLQYSDPAQNLEIYIEGGTQTLDGEKALQLVMYRASYPKGDLDRIAVQQEFVSQLYAKLREEEYLHEKLTRVFDILSKNTETNLTLKDMTAYLQYIPNIKEFDLQAYVLPGEMTAINNRMYIIPDTEELIKLING